MSEFRVGGLDCDGKCVGDKFGSPVIVSPGCKFHQMSLTDKYPDISMSPEYNSDFRYCPKGRCQLPIGHKGHCSDYDGNKPKFWKD